MDALTLVFPNTFKPTLPDTNYNSPVKRQKSLTIWLPTSPRISFTFSSTYYFRWISPSSHQK